MLKKLLLVGFCLLTLPLLSQSATAQSLDPTFARPASLYTSGAVYSMGAQQADGKRVVAGSFTRLNNVAVGSLARLDANGALDATFAQNVGIARNVSRVKTLPNGQYLVSSFFNEAVTAGGLTRIGLLRLNANGTADASFNAGISALNAGGSFFQVSSFVGQPDGKVLVGGTFTSLGGQSVKNLVRLNADGSLDTAFDANLGTGFGGSVNTLALQPDGKVLVDGAFTILNGLPVAPLVRLNADGTRDPSFIVPISQGSYVGAALVQPDGKIVVTGILNVIGANTTSIVRLTATGALDTGFTSPASSLNYDVNYFDPNVVLQPDGKLLVTGSFFVGGTAYLMRLNANGSQDNSFTVTNGPSQLPFTIGLQSDGSVLVGGSFSMFNGQESPLGRLTATGAADASFAPKVQAQGSVTALARQADGKLVLGGDFNEYNGVPVHRVARVSATGILDTAFTTATGGLPVEGRVTSLVVQPDGKLLLGATSGLQRLLTTGSADASFSTFAATTNIEALALQPDGKVVVAGYFNNIPGSNSTQALARLTATGALDTSFTPSMTNAPGETFYLTAIALQPDGKVLVGGSFLSGSGPVLRVLRYETTGAVDASFSSSTTFEVSVNSTGAIVRFNALAVQPDGNVLVGGYFATVSGTGRTNMARLTTTGQFDATFTPPPTLTGAVTAMALQSNGRILVGSGTGNDGSPTTTPLVRLLDTGASDPSFGTTANPDNSVAALLVQPDGAAVVAGSFTTIGGQLAVGVARLTTSGVLAASASNASSTFSVWPVPAHGLLHAIANADAQGAELRDGLGRVVWQQELRGAGEFTLATENLPAGVYVLRVQSANGIVARRVVIE
jgi:uncharacterized delta-60 repeat protein